MNNNYERPVAFVIPESAEGIYAASGSGNMTVRSLNVWDRWNGGGKGLISVSWSGINGTVSLTINFNNTINQVEVEGITANSRVSGSSATITFNASEASSCTIGVHVNNGSNIDALAVTGYDYSVT